jgi:hypothetical protein
MGLEGLERSASWQRSKSLANYFTTRFLGVVFFFAIPVNQLPGQHTGWVKG